MNGKLFLSHAHADKAAAQALRRALEDRGIAVWEDVLELRAGDRLAELEREVKAARGLAVLWTAAAAESPWVEQEVGWASRPGGGRRITRCWLRCWRSSRRRRCPSAASW